MPTADVAWGDTLADDVGGDVACARWQVTWHRPLWQMTWLLPRSGWRGICHAGRWCGVCHVSFTGPTTWIISHCTTCLPLKRFFITKHVHFHHGKHSYHHRRHQKTSLYLVFFHHRSTIAQITYNSNHTQLRSHSRSYNLHLSSPHINSTSSPHYLWTGISSTQISGLT